MRRFAGGRFPPSMKRCIRQVETRPMEAVERVVEDMRGALASLRSIVRSDTSLTYTKQLLAAVRELDAVIYGLERDVIDDHARQGGR